MDVFINSVIDILFRSPLEEQPPGSDVPHQLSKIDPEFYQFLKENDSKLLENDMGIGLDDFNGSELENVDSTDEDSGNIEPRPLQITSRKYVSDLFTSSINKTTTVFIVKFRL